MVNNNRTDQNHTYDDNPVQNHTPDEKDDKRNESRLTRDVNSKDVFRNNRLASQFLRDYLGLSIFSDITPEDLEDVTERYRYLLGIEIEGDTVKKVRIHIQDKDQEVYVVSLIEHKSQVDYDVAMQLLRYMSAIWWEHAKKENEKKDKVSRNKNFRYPLIIPVIYYEEQAHGRQECIWQTG